MTANGCRRLLDVTDSDVDALDGHRTILTAIRCANEEGASAFVALAPFLGLGTTVAVPEKLAKLLVENASFLLNVRLAHRITLQDAVGVKQGNQFFLCARRSCTKQIDDRDIGDCVR